MNNNVTVTAQMLIRADISRTFNAFVDPDVTSKFWFSRSTGQLEQGGTATWFWDWYGVQADVRVLEYVENERLQFEWGEDSQVVTFEFSESADGTLVLITVTGFAGSAAELLAQTTDSKGGFTMVLAGAKAYLEHGIMLQLVPDQFPV